MQVLLTGSEVRAVSAFLVGTDGSRLDEAFLVRLEEGFVVTTVEEADPFD